MLKPIHLALLATLVAPLAMAAEDKDGARPDGPPPAAFEACAGKQAGDKASMSGPEGRSFSGVCRDVKGKLALTPEGGRGGEGRGPGPEAFKACEGKSAGDTASITGPEGRSFSGTCRERDGKLALMPDRKPKGEHEHHKED